MTETTLALVDLAYLAGWRLSNYGVVRKDERGWSFWQIRGQAPAGRVRPGDKYVWVWKGPDGETVHEEDRPDQEGPALPAAVKEAVSAAVDQMADRYEEDLQTGQEVKDRAFQHSQKKQAAEARKGDDTAP